VERGRAILRRRRGWAAVLQRGQGLWRERRMNKPREAACAQDGFNWLSVARYA
jgi:hypothetical protein